MPPVVLFTGLSGSGKTTLIERLVPKLKSQGLRVATLKHDGHGFESPAGKDTTRHMAAGSLSTILSDDRHILLERRVGPAPDGVPASPLGLARRYLADADIVLAEGFSGFADEDLPRIEVLPPRATIPKGDPNHLSAIVADGPIPGAKAPRFDRQDLDGITEHVLRAAGLAERQKKEVERARVPPIVELRVDGVPVPLTPFVQRALGGAIRGIVENLKGVTPHAPISVEVSRGAGTVGNGSGADGGPLG